MVQSINTKALVTLLTVLRRPGLLIPHVTVSDISEINYTALQQYGNIEAIVFDKDNTLTTPYVSTQIHKKARLGLLNAISVFGPTRVAILSNSAGTYTDDPNYIDAKFIEDNLNISVIRHYEKKPGGLQEVLDHFQLSDPSTICIIGDRILTDVVFGNLHGMLTIHTMPLCGRGSVQTTTTPPPPVSTIPTDSDGTVTTTTTTNNIDDTDNDTDNDNSTDNWTAKLIRPIENSLLYNNYFLGRSLRSKVIPHKYWSGPAMHSLKLDLDHTKNNNNDVNQHDDTIIPEQQQQQDKETEQEPILDKVNQSERETKH